MFAARVFVYIFICRFQKCTDLRQRLPCTPNDTTDYNVLLHSSVLTYWKRKCNRISEYVDFVENISKFISKIVYPKVSTTLHNLLKASNPWEMQASFVCTKCKPYGYSYYAIKKLFGSYVFLKKFDKICAWAESGRLKLWLSMKKLNVEWHIQREARYSDTLFLLKDLAKRNVLQILLSFQVDPHHTVESPRLYGIVWFPGKSFT